MERCPVCGADAFDAGLCARCGLSSECPTASFEAIRDTTEHADTVELGVTEVPVLIVRKGVEVGERFYIDRPQMSVGRDPGSDIFLNDVTVSRSHALLAADGNDVTIKDAGSLNGTYVNDRIVTEASLRSGDMVQIGRFQMVFLSGGS